MTETDGKRIKFDPAFLDKPISPLMQLHIDAHDKFRAWQTLRTVRPGTQEWLFAFEYWMKQTLKEAEAELGNDSTTDK